MLVASIISLSHNVLDVSNDFKRLFLQDCLKSELCDKVLRNVWNYINTLTKLKPRPGGSVVSMSDSCAGGCEFDPRLRRTFFLANFRLSPLQKRVRKVVSDFGKNVVLVLV